MIQFVLKFNFFFSPFFFFFFLICTSTLPYLFYFIRPEYRVSKWRSWNSYQINEIISLITMKRDHTKRKIYLTTYNIDIANTKNSKAICKRVDTLNYTLVKSGWNCENVMVAFSSCVSYVMFNCQKSYIMYAPLQHTTLIIN